MSDIDLLFLVIIFGGSLAMMFWLAVLLWRMFDQR